MCGIFCIIQKKSPEICSKCLGTNDYFLQRRGPDTQSKLTVTRENFEITLAGYVLWLQGPEPIKQPITTKDNYLLFNGDIFGGGGVINPEVLQEKGDTIPLFETLNQTDSVISVFREIQGPYAFIYLKENCIYFGRDPFGRRSLLFGTHNGNIVISSILKRDVNTEVIELPPLGIYIYNLSTSQFNLIPWNIPVQVLENGLKEFKIEINVNYNEYTEPNFSNLVQFNEIETSDYSQLVIKFGVNLEVLYNKLKTSVEIRGLTQPKIYSNSIGILFSGGLDCTILAAMVHLTLPLSTTIDLYNVAFKPQAPDRITGIESFEELQKLYPERTWNFYPIDVSQEELNESRSNHITHLIHPLKSVLDDSLGCALWFASRKTTSRLLFVGMGADELFGGYTRHRNTFRRNGWDALNAELQSDWNNLPHRNLGRDDRVCSDHGVQLRTPYLDETFVEYVRSLPLSFKCYLHWEQGIGDKLALRLLAYKLGFRNVTYFKKRALQFGSKIANSKENAKNISERL